MKKTWLPAFVLIFSVSNIYAQTIQSSGGGTGAWGDPNSWSSATVPTNSNSTLVEILNGHTITVTATPASSVDQFVIRSGGTLIINNGATLTVVNGAGDDFTVSAGATFTNNGTITIPSASALFRLIVNGTVNNNGTFQNANFTRVKFNSGAQYFHQFDDGGVIPTADWNDNSSVSIVGYGAGALSAPTAGLNQNFGHFIWDCPDMDQEIDLGGQPADVDGNFIIQDTGEGALYYNSQASANTSLSVAGNFEVNTTSSFIFLSGAAGQAGVLDVTGYISINGNLMYFTDTDDLDIICGGDFIHTAGEVNFSLTSGVVTFSLAGNFNQTGGTFSSSGGPTTISFDGAAAAQTVTNNVVSSGSISYTIPAGEDVSIPGSNFLSGAGTFTLSGTIRLGSTHASGAIQNGTSNGNIRVTSRQYNSGSSIVYEGTAAQFMGTGHPSGSGITTVINNTSTGVSLASNVTIGGLLHLVDGNLSLGIRTLTLNDEFLAETGSSIVITTSSSISIGLGDAGNFGTLVTSGSSALNNLTFNRNGQTLFLGNTLTVAGTLTHDGSINFAGSSFTINGPYTATSGALIGDGSSTLAIGGSGAISGDVPLQGTLGTLTINRPVGVTNTTSINITNALNILSGTYQGSGSVTLADNVTLTRADGTITKSISVVDNYNLVYTSTAAINTGSELVTSPSTALFDLTISPANSVTLNASVPSVTVNGTLTLSSGSFISNSKPIFLEGNVVSNATGDFTGSLVTFSNNSTLSGGVSLELDDVAIEAGATLDLGTVNLRVAGDFTPASGAIMQPGSATTFFNGTTTILVPDLSTAVRFNNVSISSNSSLTISCASCGTEGDRAGIQVDGFWDSDNFGAVFNPAPNIGSNIVTSVQFTGGSQNIGTLPTHAFWDVSFSGTGTATIANAITITNDLELSGSKTLSTGTGNYAINIGDDFLVDGGTFSPNLGTVTFDGSGAQVIDRLSGSGEVTFNNITVDKSGGSFTNATNTDLEGVFTISSNTAVDFDGSGSDVFTLVSTASRTASIAAILSPADPTIVTGNVTAQRYMDGEGTIYRYISSPVQTPQVRDLQGEIPVTGSFTGTSYPPQTGCSGCAPCTGCVTNNQSMFRFNTQLTGTINQRYEDFPANINTETLAAGRGYAVFVRQGAAPTTWDLTGNINRGEIPLTFVGYSGAGTNDGWNLVGNPYPSAIDWLIADGPTSWTRSNIDPTIYTWDASVGDYATYNRATQSSINGGSRYIAIGQAFWVRATGSPTITAREGIKVSEQPTFFREGAPRNYIRMALVNDKGRADETLIHFSFEGATDNYDQGIDSYKFPDETLNFYTLTKDNKAMGINVLGTNQCSKEVFVGISGVKPGKYSIRYSEFESFTDPVNVYFVDNYSGKSFIPSPENATYEFEVTADSSSFGDNRFKIVFSGSEITTDIVTLAAPVCGGQNAEIQLQSSQKDIMYFATINGNTVSEKVFGNGSAVSLSLSHDKMLEGENRVVVMAQSSGCDAVPLNSNTVVNVQTIYNVTSVQNGNACNAGSTTLKANGAPSEGLYRWYETEDSNEPLAGQTQSEFVTPVLQKSKTYYVAIVNEFGCESERTAVKAEVIRFEPAIISINDDKLVSNYTDGNQWYIDGAPIEDATGKELLISRPGFYKLEVKIGDCSSFAEMEYDLAGIQVYPNPVTDNLTIDLQSDNDVKASIYNSLGVEMGTILLKESGKRRRSGEINLGASASGVYLIQIQDGEKIHRKKVLKK